MATKQLDLDHQKLLGFRLLGQGDLKERTRLGGKIGDKRGEKPRVDIRLGAKVGGKVGRKES